jgi:hypothetical protein
MDEDEMSGLDYLHHQGMVLDGPDEDSLFSAYLHHTPMDGVSVGGGVGKQTGSVVL